VSFARFADKLSIFNPGILGWSGSILKILLSYVEAHLTPSDEHTRVADLRKAVSQFVAERRWEPYHTPKNLAMSIAIEAAELMEHFQWLTSDEAANELRPNTPTGDSQKLAQVADELADVLIYCLSFANATGIDLSEAIFTKLERNQERFPPNNQASGLP
jgi:dCTP diphosphatase